MPITISKLAPSDVQYLDPLLLDASGRMLLHPFAFYSTFPPEHLRVWAVLRGRYGIPTQELISYLKGFIYEKSAIEICAGCGDLGYHLGIPMTDSYQQVNDPTTALYYRAMGQAPTRPLSDVLPMDAEMAVQKYQPDVVIGSWVTERWSDKKGFGNYLGPREDQILRQCKIYLMIGNAETHKGKTILKLPHEELFLPVLVSRAAVQRANCIYIWRNTERL